MHSRRIYFYQVLIDALAESCCYCKQILPRKKCKSFGQPEPFIISKIKKPFYGKKNLR